jgi:hypothetical protein
VTPARRPFYPVPRHESSRPDPRRIGDATCMTTPFIGLSDRSTGRSGAKKHYQARGPQAEIDIVRLCNDRHNDPGRPPVKTPLMASERSPTGHRFQPPGGARPVNPSPERGCLRSRGEIPVCRLISDGVAASQRGGKGFPLRFGCEKGLSHQRVRLFRPAPG